MKKKRDLSLRSGLLSIIVLCWVIPIIIVISLLVFLLGKHYQESAEQMIRASADYAISQVQRQLLSSMEDSKSVSYDGVIRSAYREYEEQGDAVELYRKVDDYMTQKFSRSPQYQVAFVRFWDLEDTGVYVLSRGTAGLGLLQECKSHSLQIQEEMAQADTDIRTLIIDGNLYMARNLLDSHFRSYATVVLMLDPLVAFAPLDGIQQLVGAQIGIDNMTFFLGERGKLLEQEPVPLEQADLSYMAQSDGHSFTFCGDFIGYNLLRDNPWVIALAVGVGLMVLPMVFVVVILFRQHVSKPMAVLTRASRYVQSGERGYQITTASPNLEFSKLFNDFNLMSTELKKQFERAYLEQQATQKAQIKALQSQINPHFLNNTLEVINWEARLSGNDQISEMIEALSTMLGAALDRKGRTQIPLQEEMGYVDAYLRIIQWRMGERFQSHKDIAEDVLSLAVPRLILQPLVENAVEHDITKHHGGSLWVRAFREDGELIVEVEHDGSLTEEDKQNISAFLAAETAGPHVGIQNVSQRMKLIYGIPGLLTIEDTDHETIVARLRFPLDRGNAGKGVSL